MAIGNIGNAIASNQRNFGGIADTVIVAGSLGQKIAPSFTGDGRSGRRGRGSYLVCDEQCFVDD